MDEKGMPFNHSLLSVSIEFIGTLFKSLNKKTNYF